MVPDHFYAFIVSLFPSGITYAFSYGSAVVQQLDDKSTRNGSNSNGYSNLVPNNNAMHSNQLVPNGYSVEELSKEKAESKMLDLVFVVEDPVQWHKENLRMNPDHYSILGLLGPKIIAKIQSYFKAGIYFNVVMNVKCPETVSNACKDSPGFEYPTSMKYGVIQTADFLDDVINWTNLYVSGRLHKPIHILIPKSSSESNGHTRGHKSGLNQALVKNYQSALVTSFLLLPPKFTEDELFEKITSLSYLGDFRMIIGEDKNKVSNIVTPSKELFRQIYYPILDDISTEFPNHFKINNASKIIEVIYTIPFLISLIHVLPSAVAMFIRRNHGKSIHDFCKLSQSVSEEMSINQAEILKMLISRDVNESITSIVWKSSLSQGIKGFFTTGFLKAIRYCFRKITKMYHSVRSRSVVT